VTSNLVSGFDLPLLFDCRVLHTMVYCEAVRSAIIATAWLLVNKQKQQRCFRLIIFTCAISDRLNLFLTCMKPDSL